LRFLEAGARREAKGEHGGVVEAVVLDEVNDLDLGGDDCLAPGEGDEMERVAGKGWFG